jgi:hypothetical protein
MKDVVVGNGNFTTQKSYRGKCGDFFVIGWWQRGWQFYFSIRDANRPEGRMRKKEI